VREVSLTVETSLDQGTRTFYIKGVLDYSTISNFNDCVNDLGGISNIVVDLTSLDFIDSTGIGAILELLYTSSEKEIVLEIDGINEEVKDIFNTVGVFRVIEALQRRT
jgi:anti-anti-sigma factor